MSTQMSASPKSPLFQKSAAICPACGLRLSFPDPKDTWAFLVSLQLVPSLKSSAASSSPPLHATAGLAKSMLLARMAPETVRQNIYDLHMELSQLPPAGRYPTLFCISIPLAANFCAANFCFAETAQR